MLLLYKYIHVHRHKLLGQGSTAQAYIQLSAPPDKCMAGMARTGTYRATRR